MGTANVIPGVSGGTVALLTGIYERLINALKSIDHSALQMFLKGQLSKTWRHVDGTFLMALGAGVVVSILTLAPIFIRRFLEHTTLVWAFIFGLIVASVWFVGRTVNHWTSLPVVALLLGCTAAVSIAIMAPAEADDSPLYLVACGVAAICSMILPGLSGSFVLVLMGNYTLVLETIASLKDVPTSLSSDGITGGWETLLGVRWDVFAFLGIGALAGLAVFSRILAWVFKRFHDATIALMTGFILGSLLTIWPWKATRKRFVEVAGETREVLVGYDWLPPDLSLGSTWVAFGMMVVGALAVWGMEMTGSRLKASTKSD